MKLAAGLEGHELVQPEAGGVDLVLECVARPAPAASFGVAPLDHEALEDPMENQSVVVGPLHLSAGLGVGELLRPLGEPDEVRHRFGRLLREELEMDVAVVRLDDRDGVGGVFLRGRRQGREEKEKKREKSLHIRSPVCVLG